MPCTLQAWVARLADTANEMISRRFVPILKKSHVQYQVALLKQRGTFSAAGIGELICESAAKLDAELMLVASHGEGPGWKARGRVLSAVAWFGVMWYGSMSGRLHTGVTPHCIPMGTPLMPD